MSTNEDSDHPESAPDANAVIDRLKAIMRIETDIELATALGVSRSTVSVWRSRGKIPYQEIVREAIKNKFSVDWVLTGRWSDKFTSGPASSVIQSDILAAVLYKIWDEWLIKNANTNKDPWGRAFFRTLVIQRYYDELLQEMNNASAAGYESRKDHFDAMVRSMGLDPDEPPNV